MPVRGIQFAPGQYYHLYNRGANRQTIFRNETDYTAFLWRFSDYVAKYKVAVIAYCLMPNHFHFLLRQDGEAKASLPLQLTCNGYVQSFNLRHGRTGPLLEGRYKARLVDKDEYLRHVCRYIHINPVKDGFALRPELWPYSNYSEWTGRRNGRLVDKDFIATHFQTAQRYEQFVYSYLAHAASLPDALHRYLAALE